MNSELIPNNTRGDGREDAKKKKSCPSKIYTCVCESRGLDGLIAANTFCFWNIIKPNATDTFLPNI